MPSNRAVALTYAGILDERNTPAAGKRAQAVLRPLLASGRDDPVFQQTFARSSEIAGDPVRAGEAYAEAAYLNGRPEQALVQLNTLKKRSDVDYYARSPDRRAHRRDHADGARTAAAGHPRRGPGPALNRIDQRGHQASRPCHGRS